MSLLRDLITPLPVYVTRKNASGDIAEFTLSAWMVLAVMMLTTFNLLGWGIYGLYTLVRLALA